MPGRRSFEVASEPRGRAYADLLYRAYPWCAELLLVLVPLPDGSDPLLPRGRAVMADLEPHLLSSAATREWPATRLDGDARGIVHRYRLDPALLDVVTSASDRLYAWTPPELPQDVALLRRDGTPFLATVTHERWAALELSDEEEHALGDLGLDLRPLWG